MQTTLGFSLPWAIAVGQSNPVSNRKRWFGEFCFALCSCLCWHKWVFWKLLLEKRQNAAWEWLSTAEGVTLCCWGRNKQWVSQVGKSCLNLVLVNEWWQCLYLTDPSPKQWFLSRCQNKMPVPQRLVFSMLAFRVTRVSEMFMDCSNPGSVSQVLSVEEEEESRGREETVFDFWLLGLCAMVAVQQGRIS